MHRWSYAGRMARTAGARKRRSAGAFALAECCRVYAPSPVLTRWIDVAAALLRTWAVQFTLPRLPIEVMVAYGMWAAVLVIGFVVKGQPLRAPVYFWQTIRQKRTAGTT